MDDGDAIVLRRATVEDAAVLARHRAEMFHDMGDLPDDLYPGLVDATRAWVERAIPAGEYVAWVACPAGSDEVVAGAGVHLRGIIPRALGGRIYPGPQALVVNVFTERPWRRRGIAERLLREILAWAEESGIPNVVLHASPEGRPLYERLGFEQTNEMRFGGNRSA
jgi:GNAT superfamily N-acetyltransferase